MRELLAILAVGFLSACVGPRPITEEYRDATWSGFGVETGPPQGSGWTADPKLREHEWQLLFQREPDNQPDGQPGHYSFIRLEVERLSLDRVRELYSDPRGLLQSLYDVNARDDVQPGITVVFKERAWIRLNGEECLRITYLEEKHEGSVTYARKRWHTDCAYAQDEWVIAISVAVTDAYTQGTPIVSVREAGEAFVQALRFATPPVADESR
jgi:hypothetical protein